MTLSCSKKTISIINRNNFKHKGNFYCLNCLHYFGTKNGLESHKKVGQEKYFCNIVMSSIDTKILQFIQN